MDRRIKIEWISISDRLPSTESDYLTVISGSQIQICRFDPASKKWEGYKNNTGFQVSVTLDGITPLTQIKLNNQ